MRKKYTGEKNDTISIAAPIEISDDPYFVGMVCSYKKKFAGRYVELLFV